MQYTHSWRSFQFWANFKWFDPEFDIHTSNILQTDLAFTQMSRRHGPRTISTLNQGCTQATGRRGPNPFILPICGSYWCFYDSRSSINQIKDTFICVYICCLSLWPWPQGSRYMSFDGRGSDSASTQTSIPRQQPHKRLNHSPFLNLHADMCCLHIYTSKHQRVAACDVMSSLHGRWLLTLMASHWTYNVNNI